MVSVCVCVGFDPPALRPAPRAAHTDGLPELLLQLHALSFLPSGKSVCVRLAFCPCACVTSCLCVCVFQTYNLTNDLASPDFTLLLPTDDAVRKFLSRNSSGLVGSTFLVLTDRSFLNQLVNVTV